MTLRQLEVKVMRALFPSLERQRREFRVAVAEVEAQAEDLKREVQQSRMNGHGNVDKRSTGR